MCAIEDRLSPSERYYQPSVRNDPDVTSLPLLTGTSNREC